MSYLGNSWGFLRWERHGEEGKERKFNLYCRSKIIDFSLEHPKFNFLKFWISSSKHKQKFVLKKYVMHDFEILLCLLSSQSNLFWGNFNYHLKLHFLFKISHPNSLHIELKNWPKQLRKCKRINVVVDELDNQ